MKTAWERKRRIALRYDTTADLYDRLYAEEQRHKYAQLTPEAIPGKGDCALDVGCGTGLLMKELSSEAKLLVGVDISRKMLLKAKKRTQARGNSHFVLADSDFLPFRDGTFSHTLSFTLLQNVPNPSSTVKEIARTTQLDSVAVISILKKAHRIEKLNHLLRAVGLRLVSVLDGDKDAVTVFRKSG